MFPLPATHYLALGGCPAPAAPSYAPPSETVRHCVPAARRSALWPIAPSRLTIGLSPTAQPMIFCVRSTPRPFTVGLLDSKKFAPHGPLPPPRGREVGEGRPGGGAPPAWIPGLKKLRPTARRAQTWTPGLPFPSPPARPCPSPAFPLYAPPFRASVPVRTVKGRGKSSPSPHWEPSSGDFNPVPRRRTHHKGMTHGSL